MHDRCVPARWFGLVVALQRDVRGLFAMSTNVERQRTAIRRATVSRPVALALSDRLLVPGRTFFDYGCGRGDDLLHLAALGFQANGWDPAHRPDGQRQPADIVNFGYVANVIEELSERREALENAWALTRFVLIVAARLDWEARSVSGKRYRDGVLTNKGTFQKFFAQDELRTWIDSTLGARSLAAGPGIYYVFRDEAEAQSFLATRVRHRSSSIHRPQDREALYQANSDILDPLQDFMLTRGRVPESAEMAGADAIRERFGSLKRAADVVLHALGGETWGHAKQAARDDLLVYLALAAFGGRPKYSHLPPDLQQDIKSLWGSYKNACAAADDRLFGLKDQSMIDRACRDSSVGKLTNEALYVHVTALPLLAPLLRIYEGCGRALTGTVEGTTIVKLNRREPKVSYLAYPDFDRDPHPALATSVRADLRRLHVKLSDFRPSLNPPILHRKETFVGPDYPGRAKFSRLTAHEERAGLFEKPATIGTRKGWEAALAKRQLRMRGHRLVRSTVPPRMGDCDGTDTE